MMEKKRAIGIVAVLLFLLAGGIAFFSLKKGTHVKHLPSPLIALYRVEKGQAKATSLALFEKPYYILFAHDYSRAMRIRENGHFRSFPRQEFAELSPFPLLIRGGRWRRGARLKLDQEVWLTGTPSQPLWQGVVVRQETLFPFSLPIASPQLFLIYASASPPLPAFILNKEKKFVGIALAAKGHHLVAALDLDTMRRFQIDDLPQYDAKEWSIYFQARWLWKKSRDSALELWEEQAQHALPFAPARLALCLNQVKEKAWHNALPCLKSALRLFPNEPFLLYSAARAAEERSKFKEAYHFWEKLQRVDQKPEITFRLGLLAFLYGDFGKTLDAAAPLDDQSAFYGRMLREMLRYLPEDKIVQ